VTPVGLAVEDPRVEAVLLAAVESDTAGNPAALPSNTVLLGGR
jgi:hypothetical protein